MKIKTITICSSAAFYKQVIEIQKELKKHGYKVLIPKTAHKMRRNNDFDVSHYKTWYQNAEDYTKKKQLMVDHFKKVIKADAVLLVNEEKHGMPGYIGGNVLMEMVMAFHYKKRIFILNPISPDLPIKEEVYFSQWRYIEN
jgi:diphthamide synthase subunit DPH2